MRTDVYALGCVLYQALSGRIPYPRETDAAKMYAHMATPPPSVSILVEDVPEALTVVVQRAMAKEPADRFQNAGELAAALRDTMSRPGAMMTLISPSRAAGVGDRDPAAAGAARARSAAGSSSAAPSRWRACASATRRPPRARASAW